MDGSGKFFPFDNEWGKVIMEWLPAGDKEQEGDALAVMNLILTYRRGSLITEKKEATIRKEAEEKIKEFMIEIGRAKIVCDGYSVSYTEVAGRKTLDKKMLEIEIGNLDAFYKNGKPTTRLSITGG